MPYIHFGFGHCSKNRATGARCCSGVEPGSPRVKELNRLFNIPDEAYPTQPTASAELLVLEILKHLSERHNLLIAGKRRISGHGTEQIGSRRWTP